MRRLNLLRKLGTFVEYSVFKDDISVDWSVSDDEELDVRSSPSKRAVTRTARSRTGESVPLAPWRSA